MTTHDGTESIFRIAPASWAPWVTIGVIFVPIFGVVMWHHPTPFAILIPIVAAGPVLRSVIAGRTAEFIVTSEGLRIRGDWWGRLIPRDALRVDEARRVDFAREPALKPGIRTFGTGLPGYCSGWFSLNGGRGLLYLTRKEKAVYVPTNKGFDLLLSPNDPGAFLAALGRTRDGAPEAGSRASVMLLGRKGSEFEQG